MYAYNAIIVSIYDGDTLRADIDLGFGSWIKNQALRIAHIDTPELKVTSGGAALAFAKTVLPVGTKVVIKTYKDKREKYGRWLADIKLPDGSDYAETMIKYGYAVKYEGGAKEQDNG